MKYLGIKLPTRLASLFEVNFPTLWDTLQADLLSWKKVKVSWFGRLSIKKMNVLPRLLYLFQTIPTIIPRNFFAPIKSSILKFIWHGSRPRVRWTTLTRPKSAGGVALPDLHKYYFASHLLRLTEWSTGGRRPLWLDLEEVSPEVHLWALPWIAKSNRPDALRTHPLITATLRVWDSTITKRQLSSYPSPLLPLADNPAFPVGLHPTLGSRILCPNYPRASAMLKDATYQPPWEQTPGPNPATFSEQFNYFQILHYLRSLPGQHRILRTLSTFERLCVSITVLKHGVSILYALLNTTSSNDPPPFESRWAEILDTPLTEEGWSNTYELIHHGTPMAKMQEQAYKIL
uniref:Reverse transcriptase n=1 Tax=Leptobrachium leishanense TaxID=445787 RepID=A0A8C5QU70_9ANUR